MTSCARAHLRSSLFILGWLAIASLSASARDEGPHWIRVDSAHFSLLTDESLKRGTEVILRLEQERAVFGQLLMKSRLTMAEPLEVIAFKTREEYAKSAPLRDGQPISRSGFFVPGNDRNYIVLDLSDEECWRAVSLPFAKLFLDYNYPPTQSWFDEGFAEYFSSLRLDNQQARIGADPASFGPILNGQPWLPIPGLFATRFHSPTEQGKPPSDLFIAESWMVMHYLLDEGKLPQTGTYFGLVENQKLGIEQAIQQAYGVSTEQFERAVKDYFRSIASQLQAEVAKPDVANSAGPVHQFAIPVGADDVGTSFVDIPIPEARAFVSEMTLRLPERREQSIKDLRALIDEPKGETAVAHRALAWAYLQEHNYDQTSEELSKASDINQNDFWVRYYLALMKYDQSHSSGKPLQGMPNMMQDLHAVLDAKPDFAEAYNMLAMTQLAGGGITAATASMRSALQLNTRNQTYLLNMVEIYIAGKKWDPATALLHLLKESPDAQIAAAARKDLQDLPTLRKYGIRPQEEAKSDTSSQPTSKGAEGDASESSAGENKDSAAAEQPPPAPEPDRRKVEYLRGKLLSVDCSQSPAAVLKVATAAKTIKLRTGDYKSLLLIGADEFSCDWKGLSIVANYKAGGKADGDLVSVEIR